VSFGFYVTYIALWALVIFQSLVMFGMLREMLNLRQRLAPPPSPAGEVYGELPPGTAAPDFTARELRGGGTVSRVDLIGRRLVLLFLSPHCKTCEELTREAQDLYRQANSPLVAFCAGEEGDCARHVEKHGFEIPVLHDPTRQISQDFGVMYTPTAIVLDARMRILAYSYPQKAQDMKQLLEQTAV
jgi:peroxiredoxin